MHNVIILFGILYHFHHLNIHKQGPVLSRNTKVSIIIKTLKAKLAIKILVLHDLQSAWL